MHPLARCALAAPILAGCGGGDSDGDAAGGPCIEVSSALEKDLGVDGAKAVEASQGLGNSPRAWYISTANGATWVTNIDPAVEEDRAGLIAALNATARATSEAGFEVGPNPGGFSDDDERAGRSRGCFSR